MSHLSVCVLTTTFPLGPDRAMGMHVLEKCKALIRNGTRVTVVAPHHDGAAFSEEMEGVTVRRFRYCIPARLQRLCYGAGMPANLKNSLLARLQVPFFLLSYLLAAWRAARGHDLIHCHWSPSGLVGVLVRRLLRKPVVLMMHHAELNSRLVRFVINRASHVIFNSSFTEKHMLDILPVDRHCVIPPGIDFERFTPNPHPGFREAHAIPQEAFLVFAMGRFIELKGFEGLLQALALLDETARLILAGDGPLRNVLETFVTTNHLEDRVRMPGFIPPEETPAYYNGADLFVLPSIIDSRGETEAMGLVLVEACACGTPCIASRVGGIPDIIQDGRNGWLVPPGDINALADKIGGLMNDPGKLEAASAECRNLVRERFEWDSAAARIKDVYDSIVEAN